MTQADKTNTQFKEALSQCRRIYSAKLGDYGPSWRVLRPEAMTDQLFIKAKRIRNIQLSGHTAVGEGILPEFMGIVNYSIMGIIQLRHGFAEKKDMTSDEALKAYDEVADEAFALMTTKNTDYGEAWRDMRIASYVDLILAKILRVKEIEDNRGEVAVSEGIDANYLDMLNYAIFGIIKMMENEAS